MKILIVSDTHGHDGKLEEAVERERPFDLMIHCGDVEGREIFIEALAECPVYMVSGNNDFFCDLPRELEFEIAGKRAFLTHGHYLGVNMDLYRLVEETQFRECEMVFFGHTHKPVAVQKDGVLVVNPGSLSYPRQEGRKPSYAVMETVPGEISVEIRYLKR